MTEVPEHLLRRAQASKQKAAEQKAADNDLPMPPRCQFEWPSEKPHECNHSCVLSPNHLTGHQCADGASCPLDAPPPELCGFEWEGLIVNTYAPRYRCVLTAGHPSLCQSIEGVRCYPLVERPPIAAVEPDDEDLLFDRKMSLSIDASNMAEGLLLVGGSVGAILFAIATLGAAIATPGFFAACAIASCLLAVIGGIGYKLKEKHRG